MHKQTMHKKIALLVAVLAGVIYFAITLPSVFAGTSPPQINPVTASDGRIQGIVLDEATGKPISNIHVELYENIVANYYGLRADQISSALGRFDFASLPLGHYKLYFRDSVSNRYRRRWYDDEVTEASAKILEIQNDGAILEANETLGPVRRNPEDAPGIDQLGGDVNAVVIHDDVLLVGQGSKLSLFSYASRNNIHLLGQTKILTSAIADVAVHGSYAFVTNGLAGIRVFDISVPAQPRDVGRFDLPAGKITIKDDMALVAGIDGMYMVSIANPTQPVSLTKLPVTGSINQIIISGTRAYLSHANSSVQMVDIQNPLSPVIAASASGLAGTAHIAVRGNFVYAISKDYGVQSSIRVYDANTLKELASYASPYLSELAVLGDRLYCIDFGLLSILDIGEPSKITPLYWDYDEPIRTQLAPKQIFASEGHIIVLDHLGGLRTIEGKSTFGATALLALTNHLVIAGKAAFMGDSRTAGIGEVTLTNPQQPHLVRQHLITATTEYLFANDLATTDNRLYTLNRTDFDVSAWDISNPSSLNYLGSIYTNTKGSPKMLAASSAGWAIVADDRQVTAIDTANVAALRLMGSLTLTENIIDVNMAGVVAYVQTQNSIYLLNPNVNGNPGVISSISISNTSKHAAFRFPYIYYEYKTLYGFSGVRVIDVSNPEHPTLRGQLDLSEFGPDKYIADDEWLVATCGFNKAVMIDIRNPDKLRVVSDIYIDSDYVVDMGIQSNYLYLLGYSGSLWSYSLAVPTRKVLSASGRSMDVIGSAIQYEFAPNSVITPTLIQHTPLLRNTSAIPANSFQRSEIFQLTAIQSGTQLSTADLPFTFTLPLSASIATAAAMPISLFRWGGTRWEVVTDSIVDTARNRVVAHSKLFGQYVLLQSASAAFLPIVLQNASSSLPDLHITGYEATQSVQSLSNTVPLVANRKTVLRVYAESGSGEPVENVTLSITAMRNGKTLPESPLQIDHWATFSSTTRNRIDRSYNLTLPASWTTGQVQLTMTLDPKHTIVEANTSNNTLSASLIFSAMPPLVVKIVPINYTDTPTGQTFVYTDTNTDPAKQAFLETFPISEVSVALRAPLNFSGDLRNRSDWNRLLELIAATKRSDGVPESIVYYGLVSDVPGRSALGGIALLGNRSAVGLGNGNFVMLHEVGHTFGLLHAPCFTGDPDPKYPYPNGSIGEFGMNTLSNQIYEPDTTFDIMGVCFFNPFWFSDYHTIKLFQDQLKKGVATQAQPQADKLIIEDPSFQTRK